MFATMPTGPSLRDLTHVIIVRPDMVPLKTPIEASDNLIPDETFVGSDVNFLPGSSNCKCCNPSAAVFDLFGGNILIIDSSVVRRDHCLAGASDLFK